MPSCCKGTGSVLKCAKEHSDGLGKDKKKWLIVIMREIRILGKDRGSGLYRQAYTLIQDVVLESIQSYLDVIKS